MAYNILLASPQAFTASLDNELFYQWWKSTPASPYKIKHFIGAAAPAPIPITVDVENVFVTFPVGKYASFYVNAQIIQWNGSYPNLVLTGAMANGEPGVLLTSTTLQKAVSLSFQSLSLLTPGILSGSIDFYVNGVRSDSGLTDKFITRHRIYVELDVQVQSGLITNIQELFFSHIKNDPPLAGKTLDIITANNFEITLPDYFVLTGGNLVYAGTAFGNKEKYTGSGNQTITVALKQEFDLFTGTLFTGYLQIKDLDAPVGEIQTLPWTVNLTANLLDVHGFVVDPKTMEFFAIKGLESGSIQELDVTSSEIFTVTFPFWLQVSPASGANHQVLSVKPISANNLVPGDYNGAILLTSASAELEVPVLLKVVESIDEAFTPGELNFTDQNKEVTKLFSDDPNYRASLDLEIIAYDLKGFASITYHPFKVAFFDSSAEIHIGEIVARRFKKFSSLADVVYQHYNLETDTIPLFKIHNYYKPAGVDITLDIESRQTGSIANTKKFTGVQFIKGRKPKMYASNYGILNYNPVPIRVTKKSQLLFNFIRKIQDHELKIYRNDVLYKTVTHSPGGNALFGMAMYFKDFLPGDVIDVRMGEDYAQQYVVFPEQDHSHHIVFMNEYNVLESYEFTGELKFSSDYESVATKTYRQLVERLENLETNKEQSLTINSGWVLKSNQVIMDAIIRAKRVWFVNEGREISLTPVSKKLVNEDSEQELYEYDLEFKINSENDLEVYISK